MKKFLGILFLLIIVAAGVCAYFFPGIPYKYKCTHELELTDSIWETFPIICRLFPRTIPTIQSWSAPDRMGRYGSSAHR